MAEQPNQPARGNVTTNNPIAHVPFERRDLAGYEQQARGGKELVPVTPELRASLQASAGLVAEQINAEPREANIPGVMVVRLREIAIAKTHRPATLIAEASMSPVGHGEMNEILVAVDAQKLATLNRLIGSRTTKAIKANLSAIDGFEAWTVQRRLPKYFRNIPIGDVYQMLIRMQRRLMIKPFKHSRAETNDHIIQKLIEKLDNLNLTYQALTQSRGPSLFLVDVDDTFSFEAFESLLKFSGIRQIKPEPKILPSALVPPGVLPAPTFTRVPPPPDAPIVAVFDSGVDPATNLMRNWVVSRDTYVLAPETDYAHGTAVSSLIIDSIGLNEGHIQFPRASCVIHDVCALEVNGALEGDLILRLREAIEKNPHIHIWNLSLGGAEIGDDDFSDFGKELDALSDQYNVLFIVAAGNYIEMPRRTWPPGNINLGDRISSPSDAVRALTIGAVTHKSIGTSLVGIAEPAAYSRRGPGPVFTPKPDIVHIGGNSDVAINTAGVGVNVLSPGDAITCGCGTSYAAPIAAAIAARTWQSLATVGRNHPLAVSPTLVKVLMIHSAQLNSPDRKSNERRYYGAGMPGDPLSLLYDSDSSFTILFELDIVDSMKWRKTQYPIPPSLLHNGRFKGEVIITVAYAPPLDPNAGSEYVRFNVNVGFGAFTHNPNGDPHFASCIPADGEIGTNGLEEAQVEHGGKWSPVKIYRRKFHGVACNNWGLQATILRRAYEPPLANPLRVIIAVTLRSLDNNPNVYSEGRRLLAASNWVNQDLSARVEVPVRV